MTEASGVPRRRLGFLLQLTDQLRSLHYASGIQATAVRLLGEHLDAEQVGYAEPGEDGKQHVLGAWRRHGSAVEPGEAPPPRFHSPGAADAGCVVHHVKQRGRIVATVSVQLAGARSGSEAEIALVTEAAERIWDALELARARERIQASEGKYHRLRDAIEEGFCIIEVLFDPRWRTVDYRYLETNAAFARQTGLRDAIGRTARELTPQLDQQWFDVYGHIALHGEPARFELPAEALGHCYEVYAFRIDDPLQHRVAIIFSDITQRVIHAAALREGERRYRMLASDSARLLEAERLARVEADRAIRANDDFLATLSHELRTPLSNMASWSRLLQTQFVKDEEMLRKGLAIISDNAVAQGRLLSSLLDTSRIVSGKFELEPEPLDLNELLGSVYAGMRPSAESRGLTLTWHAAEGAAPLFADGARLRQVVENLLSNAIKFTPAGGTIALLCRRTPGGTFAIDVQDSGEGIDPALLPQVFDRFRQADSARWRGHGGLGLGLSIARQIVEMHGGSIEAHSDGRGKGATFTVTLPLQGVDECFAPSVEERLSPAARHALEGVCVLAVEDQPDMRDLLKRILEEHKAAVTVVESAAEALALLRQGAAGQRYDVLISDIGLPALDGNAFIRIVRRDLGLEASTLPAIAVSAYARQDDRQRSLDAGYQEHLTKPYGVAKLVSLIRALIGTSAPRSPPMST